MCFLFWYNDDDVRWIILCLCYDLMMIIIIIMMCLIFSDDLVTSLWTDSPWRGITCWFEWIWLEDLQNDDFLSESCRRSVLPPAVHFYCMFPHGRLQGHTVAPHEPPYSKNLATANQQRGETNTISVMIMDTADQVQVRRTSQTPPWTSGFFVQF